MKYYAGVGSRETPPTILARMARYAQHLEEEGFVLRSGGADGADTAFANAVTLPGNRQVYLPWLGFNRQTGIVVGDDPRLAEIAAKYHPVWDRLRSSVRALHTRNVAQMLGHELPVHASSFVLCWTPAASGSGGTGQAIRIARAYEIPVYDLADSKNTFERDWL